jgi:hypothetical protein
MRGGGLEREACAAVRNANDCGAYFIDVLTQNRILFAVGRK